MRFPFLTTDNLKKKPVAAFRRAMSAVAAASLCALSVPLALLLFASPALAQMKCTTSSQTSGCFADQTTCEAAQGCTTSPCPSNKSCSCTADPSCATPATNTSTAPATRTKLINPLGTSNIQVFAARAITIFTGLAGSFALAVFVYGGFMMVTAEGNDEKFKKGKDSLTWAVIGLVVMFGAYAVLRGFFSALGVQ